jgi:uridine kinase
MRDARADIARVVILAGPSGAGKSRLAGRLQAAHGWPVVRLDDFYRDGQDPGLPTVVVSGRRLPDWDDPASWDEAAAVRALEQLVRQGRAQAPTYDIASSRAVGSTTLTARASDLVLAEGIFAAEIVPALRERELLAAAYCIRQGRWRTFVRRLVRDLAQRRKPPLVLLARGWRLAQQEPQVVARAVALGASAATPAQAQQAITALGADRAGRHSG